MSFTFLKFYRQKHVPSVSERRPIPTDNVYFDGAFFEKQIVVMDIDNYIPFGIAKQMKDKGFGDDVLTYAHYTPDGKLVVSDYKAMWVTPAPTRGEALEWLQRNGVFPSFFVGESDDEPERKTWQVAYYDNDLNIIDTNNGLRVTDIRKCVDFAVCFATRFLIKN